MMWSVLTLIEDIVLTDRVVSVMNMKDAAAFTAPVVLVVSVVVDSFTTTTVRAVGTAGPPTDLKASQAGFDGDELLSDLKQAVHDDLISLRCTEYSASKLERQVCFSLQNRVDRQTPPRRHRHGTPSPWTRSPKGPVQEPRPRGGRW